MGCLRSASCPQCPLALNSGLKPQSKPDLLGGSEALEMLPAAHLGSISKLRSSPGLIGQASGVCAEQWPCAAGAASNQHLLRFINTLSVLGTTWRILPCLLRYLAPGNLKTLDAEPSCMPH